MYTSVPICLGLRVYVCVCVCAYAYARTLAREKDTETYQRQSETIEAPSLAVLKLAGQVIQLVAITFVWYVPTIKYIQHG